MNTLNIVSNLILVLSFLLILVLGFVISKQIVRRQNLIGRPPVPVLLFILAKSCVVVNIGFIFLSGFHVSAYSLYMPSLGISILALLIMVIGIILLILSSFRLKSDLIFGLPREQLHMLQTKGVYRLSRHPFYLGFIFILCASCLLYPNIVNILAFFTAWVIHHYIMIGEENFLEQQYGEEYRQYKRKVSRYITFK
ncbi:MAG: isoprenylcysteine carboxylmethyltransferase family protein [Bacteroidota bacterium]|nr:isoprenylcysteine carboxylmethyltransferase family protein [Bacteroidota bacterium]